MSSEMTQIARDISVIICAYTEKRWNDLVAAVKSIQEQTVSPREIIVVIDHNTSLLERAKAYMTGITLIENSQPQGSSGARNSGIAIARGALLAFLDDDATAEVDWLERLSDGCADYYVLGVGGKVEPFWTSKRPAWFPKEFDWVVGCSYEGLPESSTEIRNLYCGCACIRREVFELAGGFRNGIGRVGIDPMSCEETELCIRAQQHWPQKFFLYEPQAIIHHHIPSFRASWRYFIARCYAEGRSKAIVAEFVGTKDGLASERAYIYQTLPRGMVRGIADGLQRLDASGFLRAGAILAGLSTTAAGYVVGLVSQHVALRDKPSASVSEAIRVKVRETLVP